MITRENNLQSQINYLKSRINCLCGSILNLSQGSQGYKVYTALLTQTGTDAPVATVLENTLGGTVVWTREGGGEYIGTLAGAFTENKTWFNYPNTSVNEQSQGIRWLSENTVGLNYSVDYDGIAYVEIRVYP